ncbi:MAG: TetR family transcriptional regulator [Gemmatimonadetes bacterium]|nr:MAG: TetR family transcriptional regulator [Gemmatimonadota bacterium]PYP54448.1 MAG: TetR family transcriptional regulator [Gemmatimonadota bacterium]
MVQTDIPVNGKKPRKKGRSAVPVRERILVAAGDLFHRQGIRGVGVEAIAEAAQTNKMTLYRYFDSKDELIAEWVKGIVAQKEEEWKDLSAKHRGDPEGQLQDWSRRVSAKLRAMEERGSALGNALAELPDPNHPARRVIQDHKIREHKRIIRLCKAAGFRDPALSANLFTMMLEGVHSCVQCIGMRQIGEHLVQLVDLMVENNRQRQPAAR